MSKTDETFIGCRSLVIGKQWTLGLAELLIVLHWGDVLSLGDLRCHIIVESASVVESLDIV